MTETEIKDGIIKSLALGVILIIPFVIYNITSSNSTLFCFLSSVGLVAGIIFLFTGLASIALCKAGIIRYKK